MRLVYKKYDETRTVGSGARATDAGERSATTFDSRPKPGDSIAAHGASSTTTVSPIAKAGPARPRSTGLTSGGSSPARATYTRMDHTLNVVVDYFYCAGSSTGYTNTAPLGKAFFHNVSKTTTTNQRVADSI